MIEFQLDETSGVATYLQLVQQVHQALRMGMLRAGETAGPLSRSSPSWPSTPTPCTRPTESWSERDWCAPGPG